MEHFIRLARRGRPNTGASSGEVNARKLALAIIEYAPGLDDEALRGAADFLQRAPLDVYTARDLITGKRTATPN
jgi:hypothetical protein